LQVFILLIELISTVSLKLRPPEADHLSVPYSTLSYNPIVTLSLPVGRQACRRAIYQTGSSQYLQSPHHW
jgi:hypothetical protein